MTIIRRLPNWQEYASLPEYIRLVNLLEKGIGIHHSGMLPVLREIVELMISKKYVRVLFATESFAIGLDCPIKTAVFISLKKHDGTSGGGGGSGGSGPRHLMPHEYTQMAGRAGRRGIDTVGNVVHCVNLFSNFMNQITYKEILGGVPQRLTSKFKIDYKMVLNLISNNDEIGKFTKQSMLSKELDDMTKGIEREIADLEIKCKHVYDVPIEKLKEYYTMQEIRPMASNKKLKEIDRDVNKLVDEFPTIAKDAIGFREMKEMEKTLSKKRESLVATNICLETGIENVLSVLRDRGVLTENGMACASIAEVNPVLMFALFQHFNDFDGFDPISIAGFLSLFTDVRDQSVSETCDEFINKKFTQFKQVAFDLIACEESHGIKDSIHIDDFCFNIADDVLEWCQSNSEDECKIVLSRLLDSKGVSVGDFTKAMLKISTVVRELTSVCEKTGKIDLMNRLSKVDGLILKHVSSNQSLYL